jgi:BCD family chlorophyll transporter-like MFS transporter
LRARNGHLAHETGKGTSSGPLFLQAIAFGVGGFLGTAAVDIARHVLSEPGLAYSSVFIAEALLFLASAVLAGRLTNPNASSGLSADMTRKTSPIAAGT